MRRSGVNLRFEILTAFLGLVPALASHPAGAQTTASCQLEYVVTPAISSTPLLTWQDAVNSSIGGKISATLPQESYSSASVAIKAGATGCDHIAFSVSDLKLIAGGSKFIEHNAIKINYVKKWFQAGSTWTGISPTGPRKLTPELLLNDPDLVRVNLAKRRNELKLIRGKGTEYVDVSTEDHFAFTGSKVLSIDRFDVRDADYLQPISLSDETQQIWLKLSTTADTQAGVYAGSVTAKIGSQILLNIPIEITVLPFVLPRPKLEYSIYYRGQLTSDDKGSISSEYKNQTQYKAELANIQKHGVTNPTVYHEFDNAALLKKALAIRKESGFTDKTLYYMGLSAGTADDPSKTGIFSGKIKQILSAMNALGYTDVYLYGIDEAKGDKQRKQAHSWGIVHTAGAKVFAAGGVGSFANVGQILDTLILAYEPDRTEVKSFHNAGKRVLTYAFPQTGPENPEIFRRNYGVKLWAAGVDGAMPYAYMHSFGSSWNDFDHDEYRDHHFAYPTSNGVIDTIAWEGFHEAIEDVRYLTALENSIDKVISNGCSGDECRNSLVSAQTYLDRLRRGYDQKDLYEMRNNLSRYLSQLSAHNTTVIK